MQSEILKFVRGFDIVADFFLTGYCYWFSVILKERFDGEIMYDEVINHFVCKIGEDVYDASGCVTGKYNLVPWDGYEDIDYLNHERIVLECVEKRGDTSLAHDSRRVLDCMKQLRSPCKIALVCREACVSPDYLKDIVRYLVKIKRLKSCEKIGRDMYMFETQSNR